MKKIGFLSFGHWSSSPYSKARSASDTLLQSIELAVAAEELGADGAYFRVHHFARQLASPFPLLAAVGARTSRIEIGTGVIDMRYENALYMAEDAGAADLIAGGRLQLGISRGSPEQVIDGWRYFGYEPAEGETEADMARRHAEVFLKVLEGEGFAQPNPRPMFPNPPGLLRLEPHSEGLRQRVWWGSGSNTTAKWAAGLGMHLMSSTLKDDENGKPFHVQQAEQIAAYREAWKEAEPRGRAAGVGEPLDHADRQRDRPRVLRSRAHQLRPGRLHRRHHQGRLRAHVRRRARRARQGAGRRRGDSRGRHAPADGAQPARRGLQRPPALIGPDPRRPRTRLALTATPGRSDHRAGSLRRSP
ncbi:LLM class flavin-dependent oxidoreductase [Nonomuraea ferruginea]